MKNLKELEIGGLSFGLTSGIITTLGLIIGIESATNSKLAVIAAILSVALADSLSDAMGMHLSEESRKDETNKPIWAISLFTFIGKAIFSLIFLIPIVYLDLDLAIKISSVVGIIIISILAIYIAHRKSHPIIKEVLEHVSLAIIVIFISYYLGSVANKLI